MEGKEMKGKAEYFSQKQITIHITCFNGRFYNGLIMEINDEFLIINDRLYGETPIYFTEIEGIERFREERK